MKDGKEELKDIESEIRARALAWLDESMTRYDLRLADRIAEARKRETGNATALRAALETILRDCKGGKGYDHTGMKDKFFDAIEEQARAALAAPARNCDLFADYASALEYWQTHEECAEVNGCFDVWLMARAEGGKA